MRKIYKFWKILIYLINRFFEDDCANRAAALTYTTLLSIVPIMMVSFWVLSWFPIFSGTGEILQNFIISNFVAGTANVVNLYIQKSIMQLTQLSISNLIFLVIVSILMFFNVVQAFNAIWGVRGYHYLFFEFILCLMVLIFPPILFGMLIFISNYIVSLPLVSELGNNILIKLALLYGLPYFATWFFFTGLNWFLPSCRVPFKASLIAGSITAILFELIKFGFVIYLAYIPTYRLLYGALATIPIFLLWIYLSWVIILLGVIICHSLSISKFRQLLR